MHIVDMVYFWARTNPLRPAIIELSGVITYRSLALAIDAAAENFRRNIADKSKPVAISVSTGSKMLVGLLGLLRAGFSVILADRFVFDQLSTLAISALVFERDTAKLETGTNIPFEDHWIVFGVRDTAESKLSAVETADTMDTDIFCFTSGTMGRPKLVACPQSSWQQRLMFPLNSAFFSYERMLIVPGLVSSFGFSRAYETLHAGRTLCLAPPGAPTLWLADTYGVETILASPQQALELCEVQEKISRFPLRSLKSLQIGAAYIAKDATRRIKNCLCRNVIMIYGSTEAGVVAVAPYDIIAHIPGAVGYIVPGVKVEIVDAVSRVLPVGKEGFVRVRSRVLVENLGVKRAPDEWFYTGDLGWINEEGMLCIGGRSGDIVNRGGEKLAIADIDSFLSTCSGVGDAGACAETGPGGFSEVWVGLVLKPQADIAAIRYAIESNARYRNNIDKIFVVDSIPRGALGKVQREELRNIFRQIEKDGATP